MIRVEKKSWGGWLCSCAHHLRLERPRPSLVVPGLQNPVRWLRKTCRHSGGLGDEQGAVGMGLGGQGTHFDRNALGCATAFLTNFSQNLAKVRGLPWLAHLLKLGGRPHQVVGRRLAQSL